MEQHSNANRKFTRSFVLDEVKLRKIAEIIGQHTKSLKNEKINFTIRRTDNFSFTTDNLGDVLAEVNSRWQRITYLQLSVISPALISPPLDLKISFDRTSGLELDISGEDRNLVFLTFGELQTYLDNEVATRINLPAGVGGLLTGFIAFFVLLVTVMVYAPRLSSTPTTLSPNATVDEKLNYLIRRVETGNSVRDTLDMSMVTFFSIVLIIPLFLGVAVNTYCSFFLPRNAFLIGKEKTTFDTRQVQQRYLHWTLIGVVLSGIVGLAVARMMR